MAKKTPPPFISVVQAAQKWQLTPRSVRYYCAHGRIKGAFLTGKTWNIPADTPRPLSKRKKPALRSLAKILQEEKSMGLRGGIYHRIQIDLTYNSNHIEGSKLTHDQTRFIFETNTIGIDQKAVNADDVLETANHFRCIDLIIDQINLKPSEHLIKTLHGILKNGTSDSRKEWFAVGAYKKVPNEVGGMPTAKPKEVADKIKKLLNKYNQHAHHTFTEILDFHYQFERIHPFQDGNGRVGRLMMFKECLRNNIVPFIITDSLKHYYYLGLKEWPKHRRRLQDTCLAAQDQMKTVLDRFVIQYAI